MGIKRIIFILLIIISTSVFSQNRYAVSFTDKSNTTFSINNPQEFLSQKAIDRREKNGIEINTEDIPVNQHYIIEVIGLGATFINKSKWMNLIVVEINDIDIIPSILNLPFVRELKMIKSSKLSGNNLKIQNKLHFETTTELDYGDASDQIKIMEGEFLHNIGFNGKGITIAVLDAGFTNANTISVFDNLWNENRVLGFWDFVNNDNNVFDKSSHGTAVLSTMAGLKSGEIIGTAPAANYWLLRTEDGGSESLSEEYNWLAAAEFADSVGVDIINSSLGYTVFDDSTQNHTYADMDGNTTVVTNAADKAFSKGILVVNSAGNSGNNSWFYIGAPADGNDVLSIGAVQHDGSYATFSSHGPTVDGRIKPNVTGIGAQSAIVNTNGDVVFGNGTSFSSPEIAGMVASLWQAFPQRTNIQIKKAIEQSASQYTFPDDELGYGIPNFRIAYKILVNQEIKNDSKNELLNVYPQPFKDNFNLRYYSARQQTITLKIVAISGKLVYSYNWNVQEGVIEVLNLQGIFNAAGIYSLMLISEDGEKITQKIVKQ